jgi:tetratricopeptide (TPR) repeat protein
MSFVLPAESPAADGSLRKIPFANLLIYLRERSLTGTVVFDHPTGPLAMAIRRGTPVKTTTHASEAWLSTVCRDLDLAPETKLRETWELASDTKRLHGQVLTEYGILDRDKLLRALGVQLERKIAWLASLSKDTRFRFFQGKDLLSSFGGVEEPEIPSARLVWVALRQAPPWAHIEKSMEKFASALLKISPTADLEPFGLGPAETTVIDALRTHAQTLAELTSRRLIEPSLLAPLVYGLLVTKQLELTRAEGTSNDFSTSGVTNVSSVFTPATTSVAPPAAPFVSASISPQHEEFRAEVARRLRVASSQNNFTMLGLDQKASKEEVNEAFFVLAKRWHPDKLPNELADLRSDVGTIFSMLSEAHQTLANEKKRAEYLRLVTEGGATADDQAHIRDVVDASTEFQKAEALLKRRDLSTAEEHARRALALDPEQGEHIALIAHLEIQRTDEPVRIKALIDDLDRAVSKNSRSAKAHYYRALAYKKLGRTADAMADFRVVSELDPDHVDAAREVRLHAMRASRPGGLENQAAAPKAGGLFGKLFKR